MKRVTVEYNNGMTGFLSVPDEEEIAAQEGWMNAQLESLTNQFGSLTIEE